MRSTFSGLSIALTALMVQRRAVEVTAHNVANANTEGFTRQEPMMSAAQPSSLAILSGVGQVGNGVELNAIRRMRDSFLDRQLRNQLSALGHWETTRDCLGEVELVFNEPSNSGINTLLGRMWGAWQDLSSDPDSYVTRSAVVENANVLANVIRRGAAQLAELRQEAGQRLEIRLAEIDGWLGQIADLNKQIQEVLIVGDQANDLRDRRDLLLDRLARALDVTYQETAGGGVSVNLTVAVETVDPATGEVSVSMETRALVQGSGRSALLMDADGILLWDGDADSGTTNDRAVAVVRDGELRALMGVRDQVLNPENPSGIAGQLELLARALRDQLNAQYAQGHGLEVLDAAGQPVEGPTLFFSGEGAADLAVHSELVRNPNLLRAAGSRASVGGAEQLYGEPGDGGNALAIARLQDSTAVIADKNVSVGDWYKTVISQLGVHTQSALAMAANQSLLVDHLSRNREAFQGVSLDEEAANLIRYERAFQAAARVMNSMDEMIDLVVNGLGLMGR